MVKGIAKKALIIGLDGAIPALIERFVSEGHLPTFSKLITEGLCP